MDVWFWIEQEPPPRDTNANRRCGQFLHCSPVRKQLDEEVDTPVRRSGAFYRSIAQLVVENLVHDRTAGEYVSGGSSAAGRFGLERADTRGAYG